MKKILIGVVACFMLFVGLAAFGCGNNSLPPSGEEVTQPSLPVVPVDPTPEEPSPELPDKPEVVDFTNVIEELKEFLSYGAFVFTDEYEDEILSQSAFLKVDSDYAAAVEDITYELETFEVEGFSIKCYEESGKIVFAITVE